MTIKLDIIGNLHIKGILHVNESILSNLDAESLAKSSRVSKLWYDIFSDVRIWSDVTRRYLRSDSVFAVASNSLRRENDVDPEFRHQFVKTWAKKRKIENLWLRDEFQTKDLQDPHQSSVLCLHYMPEFQTLATGHLDGSIQCYDRVSSSKTRRLKLEANGASLGDVVFALGDDGILLVSAAGPCRVQYWDVANGVLVANISLHAVRPSPICIMKVFGDFLAIYTFATEVSVSRVSPESRAVEETAFYSDLDLGVTDMEFDAVRFYILGRSGTEESLRVYSTETFDLVHTILTAGRGGVGRLLSLGRYLLISSLRDITIYDNSNETIVGKIKRNFYDGSCGSCEQPLSILQLVMEKWIVDVNPGKMAMVFEVDTLKRWADCEKRSFTAKYNELLFSSKNLEQLAHSQELIYFYADAIFCMRHPSEPAVTCLEGR